MLLFRFSALIKSVWLINYLLIVKYCMCRFSYMGGTNFWGNRDDDVSTSCCDFLISNFLT